MNAPAPGPAWWLIVLAFAVWLLIMEGVRNNGWPAVVFSIVLAVVIAVCVLALSGCVSGNPVLPAEADIAACIYTGGTPTKRIAASRGPYGDMVQDSVWFECAKVAR